MGALLSRPSSGASSTSPSVSPVQWSSRKRRLSSSSSVDACIEALGSPKKARTTSLYIYERLFLNAEDSDVVVRFGSRAWHLHKFYLSQSPYFKSMFSGSWVESEQKEIVLDNLPDAAITAEALDVTLGSLYNDEIEVPIKLAESVMAAASFFQIHTLMDHCSNILQSNLNIANAARYLALAELYAIADLRETCVQWYEVNLLSHLSEAADALRQVSTSLMMEVVQSSTLFVLQTEFSLYALLRLWVYLREEKTLPGTAGLVRASQEYFEKLYRENEDKRAFLDTERGREYRDIFRRVRLPYLMKTRQDMLALFNDHVIPQQWLVPVFRELWFALVHIDAGLGLDAEGNMVNFSQDNFARRSQRLGRTLLNGQNTSWRWTGFNFGVDLIMSYENGKITLRRSNTFLGGGNFSVKFKKQNLLLRFGYASVDQKTRAVKCVQFLDLKQVCLEKDESVELAVIEKPSFPLILSLYVLVTNCNLGLNGAE